MNTDTEAHIFSGGERQMRDRVQSQLREAANLLEEPVSREQLRQALLKTQAAEAGLGYLKNAATA